MKFRRHRYPTKFPVTLRLSGQDAKATITDVNESGARLTTDADIKRGDRVVITFTMGRIEGIVQWAAGTRVGLAFRPQIPLHMVDTMRYGKVPLQRSRFSSTGLREMR